MTIRSLSIALTVALVVAGSAYIVFTGDQGIGEMQLRAEAGKVVVIRDGASIRVEDDTAIKPGDFITTDSDGAAILRLEGERKVHISEGARLGVTSVSSIDTETGDILVEARESLKVNFSGVTAAASKADFRIDLGFGSARAASYDGTVQLSSPGEARVSLERLHEATVAGADLPSSTSPYRYDGGDAWDLAKIKDVMELDEDLQTYGETLKSQLKRGRPSLGYFEGLARRPVPFLKPFMQRDVDDLLIGFAIADNVRGPLSRAVEEAFSLRSDGGRWGVVASIMRAKPKPLLAAVQSLFVASGAVGGGDNGSQPEFTLAAAEELGAPSAEVAGSTVIGDEPSTVVGEDDGPGSPEEPSEPDEPAEKEPPEEPDDCQSGPECDIDDIEDQLPVPGDPEPSPSPSDGPLSTGLPGSGD